MKARLTAAILHRCGRPIGAAALGLCAATASAGDFADDVKRLHEAPVMEKVVAGGDRAVADLVAQLKSERPDLAVIALGRLKAKAAVPALIELAKAEDGELRASIAWALGQCADPQAAPVLAQLAGDEYEAVRAAALTALAQLKARELETVLPKAVEDRSARVRLAAAQAVRLCPEQQTLYRALLPRLDYRVDKVEVKPEDEETKPATPAGQAAPAAPAKEPEFKEVVVWAEPSPQVRLAIIEAFAELKVVDSLPKLIDALERAESFERLAILSTIESFGPTAAPVCLGRIVPTPYDKEAFEKRMPLLVNNGMLAVIAGRLGDARAVPELLKTLKLPRAELGKDKDLTELYIQTVQLLGKFKVDKAARPLAELLKETRISQLSDACQASLKQIGRGAARPLAANMDNWEVAPIFLRLLREAEMHTAAAREQIITYLAHESDDVRLEATDTLGLYLFESVLDEYDMPYLEAMYLDPNRDVRTVTARWQEKIKARHGAEVAGQ